MVYNFFIYIYKKQLLINIKGMFVFTFNYLEIKAQEYFDFFFKNI